MIRVFERFVVHDAIRSADFLFQPVGQLQSACVEGGSIPAIGVEFVGVELCAVELDAHAASMHSSISSTAAFGFMESPYPDCAARLRYRQQRATRACADDEQARRRTRWQLGPDDAVSDDDLAALGDDDAGSADEEEADGEEN